MAFDLQALMQRNADLDIAAMAALSPAVVADSKPFFRHTQEEPPYFVNRIGPLTVNFDSEDYRTLVVPIIKRLIVGAVTSGFAGMGERELELQRYIPHLIEYYDERKLLIDAVYTTEIAFLEEAVIVGCSGYTEFPDSGSGVVSVGTELTLQCLFQYDITQVYD